MESLFTLHLIRPSTAPDPRYPPIRLAQASNFQIELSTAASKPNGRQEMDGAANLYIASPEFITLNPEEPDNKALDAVATVLEREAKAADAASTDPVVNRDGLIGMLEEALGGTVGSFNENDRAEKLRARLKDSMVAIRTVSAESPGHLEILAQRLHAEDVIQRMARDATFPISKSDLARWWRRPIVAPSIGDFKSILSVVAQREKERKERLEALKAIQGQLKAKYQDYRDVHSTLYELRQKTMEHYQTTPDPLPAEWRPPDGRFSRFSLAVRHLDLLNAFSSMAERHYDLVLQRGTNEVPGSSERPFESSGASTLVNMSANLLAESRLIQPRHGLPAFEPPVRSQLNGTMKPSVLEVLDQATKNTLEARGHDITNTPLRNIVSSLEANQKQLALDITNLYSRNRGPQSTAPTVIGGLSIATHFGPDMRWQESLMNDDDELPMIGALEETMFSDDRSGLIPQGIGHVDIIGVCDLLIVKQQLRRYEGADVANIETILHGEERGRETTSTQTMERMTFTETETDTTEETDSTKASRFETSTESENAIKENESLSGGLLLSGSYGPAVSFSASAQGSLSRSRDEATKSAVSFSKEVTDKASKKIQQRVLQRSSLKVTSETVDKLTHTFKNVGEHGVNVNGVYQWVTKVYEAQTYRYGFRTMAEFMVPEPGAFILAGPTNQQPSVITVNRPRELPSVESIGTSGFEYWAETFEVSDLEPPPSMFDHQSATHNNPSSPEFSTISVSETITIHPGYKIALATVNLVFHPHHPDDTQVTISLGTWPHTIQDFTKHEYHVSIKPDKEVTGDIVYQVVARNLASWSIAIDLELVATDKVIQDWKLKTWNKLQNGRKAMMEDFNQKVQLAQATASASAWMFRGGSNPEDNKTLMRNELKRSCITLLTDQNYEVFGAVETSAVEVKGSAANGAGTTSIPGVAPPKLTYVDINTEKARAEGPYVRFFEQAFEWENMTSITYPYFWSRKESWFSKLSFVDMDPALQDFIRAGYARCSVPIRPGFEGAVDHFLSTGNCWMGGPLPGIGSDMFLPIAAEISERLGMPSGQEEPYGNSWTVRVPTNLVTLRPDDQLPKWKKVGNEWVPVKTPADDEPLGGPDV